MLKVVAAVGMMMPMQLKNSSELVAWLATALKDCVLNRTPPNKKQQPTAQRVHGNNKDISRCSLQQGLHVLRNAPQEHC
jgi:hypothetical protein